MHEALTNVAAIEEYARPAAVLSEHGRGSVGGRRCPDERNDV
jgi:hypothetical protein